VSIQNDQYGAELLHIMLAYSHADFKGRRAMGRGRAAG
jgi:hypothetical protein